MKLKMKVHISGEIYIEAEANTISQAATDIEVQVLSLDFGDLENVKIEATEFVTDEAGVIA